MEIFQKELRRWSILQQCHYFKDSLVHHNSLISIDLSVAVTISKAVSSSYRSIATGIFGGESQAIFYHTDYFSLTSHRVWDKSPFVFAPWISTWKYLPNGLTFQMVAVRISQTNTLAQIEALSTLRANLTEKNVFFLGDWNAGCGIVNASDVESLSFFTDPKLTWMLSSSANTGRGGVCASDRVVFDSNFASYVAVSLYSSYVAEHHLEEAISTHEPVKVAFQLGPKTPTPFYIELAVVGGGLLLLLGFYTISAFAFSLLLRIKKNRDYSHP